MLMGRRNRGTGRAQEESDWSKQWPTVLIGARAGGSRLEYVLVTGHSQDCSWSAEPRWWRGLFTDCHNVDMAGGMDKIILGSFLRQGQDEPAMTNYGH